MYNKRVKWLLAMVALAPVGLGAMTVAAPPYVFELDDAFPRVRSVTREGRALPFAAPSSEAGALLLDGKPLPAAKAERVDAATARYVFGPVTLWAVAEADGLTLTCEPTAATGTLTVRGAGLATADAQARFIWTRMKPMTDSPDHEGTVAAAPFAEACNYAALWTPSAGVMLLANGLNERERVRISGDGKALALAPPERFTLAADVPLPTMRWVLAPGEASPEGWQLVARAARRHLPKPSGAARTREIVTSQIAINFANLTQNPFLRTLDAVKRAALATDGLPQELLLKGYQGGGHDSSHPDMTAENPQAGGFPEMNRLVERARAYHASVGVHVNCTEAYPESRWFTQPFVTKRPAWRWLDQAWKIDKERDIRSGALFARFDELLRVCPGLGFVYVDAYQDVGYAPRKIADYLGGKGLRIWTEFDTAMDAVTVASHGRGRIKGRLVRFLWNAERDIFRHDPLLPAANHDGFLGWDCERDFPAFVRNAFARCLPAKYLQHFELLRWTDDRAVFDGPTSERLADGAVRIVHDGLEVYRATPKGRVTVAVPWPARAPRRLYLRADAATRVAGPLPKTLRDGAPPRLWRVTDLGRVELPLPEGALKEGRFALDLPAGEVWVLDARPSDLPQDPRWGEGTPLREPGFETRGFAHWKVVEGQAEVADDRSGNPRLVLTRGAVRQESDELPAGAYAVSAWASVRGRLTLTAASPAGAGAATLRELIPNRDNSACGGSIRFGTPWQRLRATVTLTAPARLTLTLAGHGAEVDDVRIVRVAAPSLPKGALWAEDFEGRDQGWGPFVYAVPKGGQLFTHRSEANPVDRALTPDVLCGRYSLKTWREPVGPILRTHEGLLPLPEGRRLTFVARTRLDRAGYAFHLCDRAGKTLASQEVAPGDATLRFTFDTPAEPGAYLRLDKLTKEAGTLALDELALCPAEP